MDGVSSADPKLKPEDKIRMAAEKPVRPTSRRAVGLLFSTKAGVFNSPDTAGTLSSS